MGNYAQPTTTDFVSCSWQCHKNRNPPSGEPGTDYGCGYGSPIYAPQGGTVTYVKRDNSGGMGRTVQIMMDDGQETRPMHMSHIWVEVGWRVERGQEIGLSGASGYGDDWYYGPHLHQTLWPGAAWSAPTIDFALWVGDTAPPPAPPKPKGDPVGTIIAARDSGGHVYYMEGGFVKHLASQDEVQVLSWALNDMRTLNCDNLDFQRMIWNLGLEEFTMDQILDLSGRNGGRNGRFLVASWRDARVP